MGIVEGTAITSGGMAAIVGDGDSVTARSIDAPQATVVSNAAITATTGNNERLQFLDISLPRRDEHGTMPPILPDLARSVGCLIIVQAERSSRPPATPASMYVIGTAGHVDHGKSTLVKALTGIDPDRLEEEQRREMTIDLGFAWLRLPGGRQISIIDVPGHERFIKNMLAGIGGIDAALLVIAADESVMPQTIEHLAILDLLEVTHGLVALTKIDLVDEEWLALVRDEVRDRLRGTSFATAPIVAVSARTGQGIDDLLRTLDTTLDHVPSRADARGRARLSIDRSFAISGFGTVVTGTLSDGPLRVGDEVEILPHGMRARVRGLQTHQTRVDEARPGSRVAVNLAGVAHQAIRRGDALVIPGYIQPTTVIDARLRVVASAPHVIEQNDRLELFVGAAETPCRVTLLDCEKLAPGEMGWVQLRLDRPVVTLRGDRYILRQPSPGCTIGGGRVMDAHPARHRRFRPEVIRMLEALARGTPADLVQMALADDMPHPWSGIVQTSGLNDSLAREGLAALLETQQALVLAFRQPGTFHPGLDPAKSGDAEAPEPGTLISGTGWRTLRERMVAVLRQYHARYPLRRGMPREELRSRLNLANEALDDVLAYASTHGDLQSEGAFVRLPEHEARPTAEQQRQIQQALDLLRTAPYGPPAPDLDTELLGWLVERGVVTRVTPDVVFLNSAYEEMVSWVCDQIRDGGSVTVARFRDRFGNSRKYALALLEHLDERRITRRSGDARIRY